MAPSIYDRDVLGQSGVEQHIGSRFRPKKRRPREVLEELHVSKEVVEALRA